MTAMKLLQRLLAGTTLSAIAILAADAISAIDDLAVVGLEKIDDRHCAAGAVVVWQGPIGAGAVINAGWSLTMSSPSTAA